MKQSIIVFGIAALGAFFGNFAAMRIVRGPVAAPSRIEAREFVLLNASGQVAARLSSEKGITGLRLFAGGSEPALEVGISESHDSRYITLFGKNGRITAALNSVAPDGGGTLYLGDDNWQARIMLGALRSDTPGREPDDWGFLFRSPGSNQSLFSLVANHVPDTNRWITGMQMLRGDGTEWSAH
jgi:hypothetical protein